MILTGVNATRYRTWVCKRKATDVFVLPVFSRSTEAYLYYHNLVLDTDQLPAERQVLKRSGVKPRLLERMQRAAHIEEAEHLWVVGDLLEYESEQWFVARELRIGDGNPGDEPPISRILQLHLLHARGFATVLPGCSWLSIEGFNAKKGQVIHRTLPKSKARAEAMLQDRLQALNEVLQGQRPSYWKPGSLFKERHTSRYGNSPLPATKLRSLELGAWVRT